MAYASDSETAAAVQRPGLLRSPSLSKIGEQTVFARSGGNPKSRPKRLLTADVRHGGAGLDCSAAKQTSDSLAPYGGAPLPSLTSALSRRREIFGPVEADSARQQVGRVYTAETPPPFEDWPAVYGLRCFGDCCEPDIGDGSTVVIDRQAPHTNGDYVAIWQLSKSGVFQAFVKRLVYGLPPFVRLPYRHSPRSELKPVVDVEAPNHKRMYELDLSTVHAVHRCIGTAAARPDVPLGTSVSLTDIRWFDRPGLSERARRNLRAVGGHVA